MWHPIEKDIYMGIYKSFGNLKCFSSFTDMDGTSPTGDGRRWLITEWGVSGNENPIIKCEERGNDSGGSDFEYFLFTN